MNIIAEEETSQRPVIIQISEGSGNAVFSLVQLESLADNGKLVSLEQDTQNLKSLRESSDARRKMLLHILILLKLSFKPLKVPELTPLFLLGNELVSFFS